MAAVSAQPSPASTPIMSEESPKLKGLKKVLSNRRKSLDRPSDAQFSELRTDSIDSITLEKSPTRYSARSVSQDGSSKSGSSGMRKLLPGHAKRKRRKLREEELKAAQEELDRGRPGSAHPAVLSTPAVRRSSTTPDGDGGLLTDDSEGETPPLVSRNSHKDYITMSSPMVSTTTTRSDDQTASEPPSNPLVDRVPTLVQPASQQDASPSPKSPAAIDTSPGLIDRADTLTPLSPGSASKNRGASPAKRFRDVFSKGTKSPKISPERRSTDILSNSSRTVSSSTPTLVTDSDLVRKQDQPVDFATVPQAKLARENRSMTSMPNLATTFRPMTPPTGVMDTPVTTVTPPTPTDLRFQVPADQLNQDKDSSSAKEQDSGIVVSPSGNMISHRKTRSVGSASHQPSKLSSSMTMPVTAGEETRAASGATNASRNVSGGFFSSWVSAAQTAASSITNIAGQNRARAETAASDASAKPKPVDETIKEEDETEEPEAPRKQLAVETLGSGDLNFEHLGLNAEDKSIMTVHPDLGEIRKDALTERDEAAAKIEDQLAKRAVSAAYEKLSSSNTPVAEIPDPIGLQISQVLTGERTPPNGSVFGEGEMGSIKRTNSVRSKLAKRRSRGSSTATGTSAIGAMIGASTAAVANPTKGPRLTGFTMAPKQRNRNFHQQFRSVPEDDYLIEDYSCALQKEILLAGRIYISEGHICFFSNILGWVTTVVISFDEVVSIERENTAVVFPNAIAIQTLHARHTFRSLLYREQTYDLLIGIWKVSHPASFQKSLNSKQLAGADGQDGAAVTAGTAIVEGGATAQGSEGGSTTEESESGDDDDSGVSFADSSASNAVSDMADSKAVPRKTSGMNASAVAQVASIMAGTTPAGEVPPPLAAAAGLSESASVDYPGPQAHAPTECTDGATHYDIALKDEVIQAPLGKVYSLLFGPESGVFVRKFLSDDCKCTDLVLEDDKKGLNSDIKSRQYTYIKPLGGSIGPRQTKCITTETLDYFDLEKAVSVTCSTQTPDVPSGNGFLTKTRYCLTWGPGNATRFQMNCTIEWSAKSWLKGPIEKGAKEGQQQYGDAIVRVLKGAVSGRPRGATSASKTSKAPKKKRKGEKRAPEEKIDEESKKKEHWGVLEPLRGPLGPVADILRPVVNMQVLVGLLCCMVVLMWFRTPTTTSHLSDISGYGSSLSRSERIAAYEALWMREESDFWDWLEDRANVDTILLREQTTQRRKAADHEDQGVRGQQQKRLKQRRQVLKGSGGQDVEAKVREEKVSQGEMEDAIRITRERLDVLEGVVERNKRGGKRT